MEESVTKKIRVYGRPKNQEVDDFMGAVNKTFRELTGDDDKEVKCNAFLCEAKLTILPSDWEKRKKGVLNLLEREFSEEFSDVTVKVVTNIQGAREAIDFLEQKFYGKGFLEPDDFEEAKKSVEDKGTNDKK